MSELALQRIHEAKKQRLIYLDLGNCGLTELPDEIFKLTWLETLNLGNEWWDFYVDLNRGQWTYSENKGDKNNISYLSDKIGLLSKIKKIILNENADLEDISNLEGLKNLQELFASKTQLNDLIPLRNLDKIQQIRIYDARVKDLSPISNLKNLQILNVSMNQINNIGHLGGLQNLKQLWIDQNPLEELNGLSECLILEQLRISNTHIHDLNPLKNLINLQQLWVNDTLVDDLSPIKDLFKLIHLRANNTSIYELAPLKGLKHLQQVDIRNTQVNDIMPLKDIINNNVEIILEEEIAWKSKGVYVKNCPLDKALIAAIKKGHSSVLKYLNKPKARLFEARVLVLGEPRAGKTTLRRKLKDLNAALPTVYESTKAFNIEIDPYTCQIEKDNEKNKLTYYLWDFGGQDYYRLLHQLFISEQAVFVIVTDTDRNKNEEEIDFWLETIQRLGKDRNNTYSPVILFQNSKTNREGSDFLDLKKRYTFWRQNELFVINLNALAENSETYDKKEVERFKRFKTYLERCFCQLDHIGKEMPTQWLNVRKDLAKYEKENWITIELFNKICASKGIVFPNDQEDLLDIFHTLGYLLHYRNTTLQGMVILNREWVTDALYRVLDDAIVSTNKGWFKQAEAERIWSDPCYKNRLPELLALMQEFKLCYYNPVSQKYIVPAKLPEYVEGLPEWDVTKTVRLHLQYDWMPRAIPTQLIVSLHENIINFDNREQWIWRRGAVLDGHLLGLKDVRVQIVDNWRNNTIEISARGDHSEFLIRTVMKNWRNVNEPFEDKVTVTKIILCPCKQCHQSKKPHTFKYESVLTALEKNKRLQCNESFDDFLASDILKGVFDESTVLADSFEKRGTRIGEELKNLIKDGKVKEALEKIPDDEFIINLKYRLNSITQILVKDTMPYDVINREQNKIVDDLLTYLSSDSFKHKKI